MKTTATHLNQRLPWLFALLAAMAVILASANARAACYPTQAEADAAGATTVRVYGKVYTGGMDALGAPLPAPANGAVNDASVMVQNMHHGGPVECYANATADNSWEAFVEEDAEYVVMFSAPGHDVTSREFTVPAGAAAAIALDATVAANYEQDAFLPPRDAVTGELPSANLLVYCFRDDYVNSEDDYPDDPALGNCTFYVFDEDGNFEASGVSGTQIPADMPPMFGPDIQGLYYFNNLKPGEHYVMAVPPGATAATDSLGNPVMNCEMDPATAGWLWMTSEEGSQCWEVVLRPGDPGTELGAYLAWFGFVENLGQLPPFTPPPTDPLAVDDTATITGTLFDADGTDPIEVITVAEVPQICLYDHEGTFGVDYTTGYHPELGRMDGNGEDCIWPNLRMKDGFVVLWAKNVVHPHPVATTMADPVTGEYQFNNVPPGTYKIFTSDYPIDYIWQEVQVTVQPSTDVTGVDLFIPRFFGRANGFVTVDTTDPVTNTTTSAPLAGAKVNVRLKDGGVWQEETAGADGYFNFDNLAEVEVLAHMDVDYHTLPSNLRGKIDPTPVCYDDPASTTVPPAQICNNYNMGTQDILWFTANYRANLHLEEIPADVGHVMGSVFNDHLSYDAATGAWLGNGVLDEKEDRLLMGVTINLLDPNNLDALGNPTVVATTTTGAFNEAVAVAQGLTPPYTPKGFVLAPTPGFNIGDILLDEWGGIFKVELYGQFEFRDVAPGTYLVEVVVPDGFSAATPAQQTITVAGGQRNDVDFGVNTLVPLAGEIEGGIFDDVFIDTNHQSMLWMEKQGLPYAPVGIYDHLGYMLGKGFMGNPLCYSPQPPASILPPAGYLCPPGEPLGQKPEVERRAAPGVHVYLGNDPTLPGYNDAYVPMALNYTFGQGQFKFEADWSLLPASFVGMPGDAVVFPANPPVIAGGAPVAKNYSPGDSELKYAVYNGTDGLKVQFASGKKDEKKKKKRKKKHSKHKKKGKDGYKGTDDNDDHDKDYKHGDNNGNGGDHGGDGVTNTPYTITGLNFGDTQGNSTVSLSGQPLNVTNWSDTSITVQIPSTAISGPMIVATTHGISNSIQVNVASGSPEWDAYLAARTLYVDSTAGIGGDGSITNPYRTITDAINNLPAAKPRYIMVAPGVYNENVEILDSDVKIIGAGPFETMVDGLGPIKLGEQGVFTGSTGPTFRIGRGETGGVSNIMISGFTITGGTVGADGIGGGIFADFGNTGLDFNNNIIGRNTAEYGGGLWLHKSNHNVRIWSNLIANNGNFGGYGGGISVNDEPEYGPDEPALDHSYDDSLYKTPPGTYEIFNNLIYHNYSPDYGGGIALYEVKDRLNLYGNMIVENRSDDHGGAIFFEDTGPIDVHENVLFRNFCADDGGAISFEDVGDDISLVRVYNNLIAENIADDRSENTARGGALAFDDTLRAEVFNNTITGNIVAGTVDPAGGAIDSERHGHEYDAISLAPKPPFFSDVKVYNNIIWDNWRLLYEVTYGEDLDYRFGVNYTWNIDNIHVDDPALNQPWETDVNRESLTHVKDNNISNYEYSLGNVNIDPAFVPDPYDWHLLAPINGAPASTSPSFDLELNDRDTADGYADMGAFEYLPVQPSTMRIPTSILGVVKWPVPGSLQLEVTTP